jgi:c-di-GMP-binding flagellar brake protein YcgR
MHQKRKYERFDLRLSGKIIVLDSGQQEIFDVVTNDVSAGGAFLHTTEPIALGTRVKLALTVASEKLMELTGSQGLMRVAGTVVRSNADGMAICFGEEYELVPIPVA